jgi:O-antigen/teichoic acid export membrane protein
MILPLPVGIVTVPILTRSLGVDRFGILMLAYATVGYFGILDLGIGRALTQVIAQRLGSDRKEEIPSIVWSAVSVMGIMAIGGMVLLHILSPWLVHHILKVPGHLSEESIHTFHLLAIAIPIIIGSVAMRGFLEAFQKFAFISRIQAVIGICGFVCPVVILHFANSLVAIVIFLILISLNGPRLDCPGMLPCPAFATK